MIVVAELATADLRISCGLLPGALAHRWILPVSVDPSLGIQLSRVIGWQVVPIVDAVDLVDARRVTETHGRSHSNRVSIYQYRYSGMPKPIVDFGRGGARCG